MFEPVASSRRFSVDVERDTDVEDLTMLAESISSIDELNSIDESSD